MKKVSPAFRKNTDMWCGCLAGSVTVEDYKSVLQKCGFTNINIEIAHVYTKEILGSEFLDGLESNIANTDLESLDGAFAGALISADK